jgi:diguanylate cyclase (GGDEF)-like protein
MVARFLDTATPMPHASRLRRYRKTASVLAMLLLAAVGATTAYGVQRLVDSNERLEQSYRVIEHIQGSQAHRASMEAAGRGYHLTSHEGFRRELDRSAPLAIQEAEDLVALTADNPGQQALATRLLAVSRSQAEDVRGLAELQERQGAGAAIRSMRVDELVASMHAFNALALEMLGAETELLEQRRAATVRQARLLLGFLVLGLGVSLATLWALLTSLGRENSRNRRLEREARSGLERLQHAQALTERLSEQRRALSEYTGLLQSAQNLDEAMELTSLTLEQLLPHVGGQCYLGRGSRDFLESRAAFGKCAVASSDTLSPEECWALRRGHAHYNRGGPGAVRCAHIDQRASLSGISTLCVPLSAQGETLGMLHACALSDGGEHDNDAAIIELLAEQLAMAVANLRLRETLRQQSLRDALTGLFNRRYFEESLRREMQRCERKRLPLALLVLDIDHFKAFNDTHGHSAGDAVLAHVGRTLAALIRAEDLACRYGGEEFTIVMPEAGASSARERAEAIRRAVSETTIVHNGRTLGPVTLSIGIASYPRDGVTPELLFEVGDASLYQAKAEGRDRVAHATAID